MSHIMIIMYIYSQLKFHYSSMYICTYEFSLSHDTISKQFSTNNANATKHKNK